ncbi:NirD/YgiW/YdeI family stress tolerance protein [Oscillatoria sp. FACHB-1407]|uniref:NirD/YgiW/YdeI family stress tolerance protein n=1 Tax=Oscillatoria sp. FACHB-1407 TaxID=2692847 RepID=UPI001688FC9A|nr:NirD/YgiW/YdeI family stress tolerance protein [Oscillatoria sp. FACHB-1407]MBD2463647.1 NirD/YgiW/YdeI family stress tolerance protein [Oscillatoria sp. FACHB-1407]
MKLGFATTLALASALIVPATAIAQTTIGDLQRQNSVTISGEVVRVQGDDFILNDGTGQILVEAESRSIRQVNLRAGDRITVAGQYTDDNAFEALSLTPGSGEAIGEAIYVFDD